MILLIKWVALALTVMFAGWIVPGVIIEDFKTAMIAAIAIAVINLVIRPVIMFFALPFNVLTLGLFTLVINALLFMFVAYVVPGVEVDGFMSALLGSLVISILSIGISWL